MAKTVKIPDNMSPWKAIINGVEYVYPAGTTQEVPDAVADFIERISKVEPEKAPVMPPFAGGADLNAKEGEPGHVLNRTHYEEVTEVGGDTLTWDGNTDGRVSLEIPETNGGFMVKLSDAVLTLAEMSGGVIEVFSDGSQETRTAEELAQAVAQIGVISGEGFWVFPEDNYSFMGMMTIPEAGLYVACLPGGRYHTAITIPGYTGFVSKQTVVKPIDPKFLPEALQFGEITVKGDTLTWDGNTEGLVSVDAFAEMLGTLYKISDAVPTLKDCISGATYTVTYDGEQENLSVGYDEIAEMSGLVGCLCIGDFKFLGAPENDFQIEVEGVTAIFPEAGLYTAIVGDNIITSLTIPGYTGFEATTLKPLDEKYLPILTSPGGKKFKLSVDDSGTLTATAI